MQSSFTAVTRVAIVAVTSMTMSLPGGAVDGDLPEFTGHQFAEMFRSARLEVTNPTEPLPAITGDTDLDGRIFSMAEEKGYVRQRVVKGDLERVDGHLVHPEAATAWRDLQAAADAAGHSIVVVSGYRSLDDQRATFLRRLSGKSEAALEYRLSWSAPPGYSKHHTGYAIDVALANSTSGQFGGSAAYQWMAADNYRNAKRFGFIPSYPPNGPPQGPNPEPWEWLYVGVDTILCSGAVGLPDPGCRALLSNASRGPSRPCGIWPM